MKLYISLVTRPIAFGSLFMSIKQPLNLRPYCVLPMDNVACHS